MASLEIRLFGTLRVGRDGRPLERLPGKRVKDLLAYLLLTRNTIHARDHLAGIFWGDQEETRARHCLNTALWRLRQALGDGEDGRNWLLIDTHSIGFNASSDVRIDVADFEQRITLADQIARQVPEQSIALLREATGLYTADLLLDCYDDWCLLERERLQRIHHRALQTLATYHAAHGEHLAAIDLGHRILGRDPLREDIYRDLMRQYLAIRQPSDALQQYRACEAILRQELGIQPMPETQALLPRILTAWAGPTEYDSSNTNPPAIGEVMAALHSALRGLDDARRQVEAALALAESYSAVASRPVADAPVAALDGAHGTLAHSMR